MSIQSLCRSVLSVSGFVDVKPQIAHLLCISIHLRLRGRNLFFTKERRSDAATKILDPQESRVPPSIQPGKISSITNLTPIPFLSPIDPRVISPSSPTLDSTYKPYTYSFFLSDQSTGHVSFVAGCRIHSHAAPYDQEIDIIHHRLPRRIICKPIPCMPPAQLRSVHPLRAPTLCPGLGGASSPHFTVRCFSSIPFQAESLVAIHALDLQDGVNSMLLVGRLLGSTCMYMTYPLLIGSLGRMVTVRAEKS